MCEYKDNVNDDNSSARGKTRLRKALGMGVTLFNDGFISYRKSSSIQLDVSAFILVGCGRKWKRIVLIGISLGGDEARLAATLKSVKAEVIWISSLPMSESQQKTIAPLLKVSQSEGGVFGGELVKQVGKALKQDVKDVLPFVVEGAKQPKGVPQYHELDVAIRQHIRRVYAKYGENVSKAAAALKITRNTLRKYL